MVMYFREDFYTICMFLLFGNTTVFHWEWSNVRTGGITVFIANHFLRTLISRIIRNKCFGKVKVMKMFYIQICRIKSRVIKKCIRMKRKGTRKTRTKAEASPADLSLSEESVSFLITRLGYVVLKSTFSINKIWWTIFNPLVRMENLSVWQKCLLVYLCLAVSCEGISHLI